MQDFDCQGLNHRPYIHQNFKMETICTTTLLYLLQNAVFIIFYKKLPAENSRIKKPGAEVKI